jgi:MoaA/NifB/PqqE/SkfB family radical SAM enzyme
VRTTEVLKAWGRILQGRPPSLSIEITKECPLRCPGCYAYEDSHLGGGVTLRQLADRKGDALVKGVLEVVDRVRPLHLSIVGGDPLVRFRELEVLLPQIRQRGVHVQLVTSAFRPLPAEWATWDKFNTVVSIDGLQPEHDKRRTPATYDRILKNIAGGRVTVHCTITGQMMQRPGYLGEFLEFWSGRPEVVKVWFSIFTPQRGDAMEEILTPAERRRAVAEMVEFQREFRKLDMPPGLIAEFERPPASPGDCIFAQTPQTISADLTTLITPCQFGGDPDCSQCGCIASMALQAVGNFKVGGLIPAGAIFRGSAKIGGLLARRRGESKTPNQSPFPIVG